MRISLRVCVFGSLLFYSCISQSARAHCADENFGFSDIRIINLDDHDRSESFVNAKELIDAGSSGGVLNLENAHRRADAESVSSFISNMRQLNKYVCHATRGGHASPMDLLNVLKDGQFKNCQLIPSSIRSTNDRLILTYSPLHDGSDLRVVMFADGNFGMTNSAEEFHALLQRSIRDRLALDLSLAPSATIYADVMAAMEKLTDDDSDVRDHAMEQIESHGMRALALVMLGARSVDPEQRTRCTELTLRLQTLWKMREHIKRVANDLGLQLPVQEAPGNDLSPSIQFHDGVAEVLGQAYSLEELRQSLPSVHSGLVAMAAAPVSH